MSSNKLTNIKTTKEFLGSKEYQIQLEILKEFDVQNYKKWFLKSEIIFTSINEITFLVPSEYIRNKIIKKFIKTKQKNLKNVVNSTCPEIEKLSVLVM
jgi:hypothetical protein